MLTVPFHGAGKRGKGGSKPVRQKSFVIASERAKPEYYRHRTNLHSGVTTLRMEGVFAVPFFPRDSVW